MVNQSKSIGDVWITAVIAVTPKELQLFTMN